MTTVTRPATDTATDYARAVIEGREPACRLARLACERHLRDLEEAPGRGLIWDSDAAEYVIDFVQLMPQRKGEWQGKPIKLMPWQRFRIGCFFGWKRANSLRRFRTSYTEVPRGTGKTTEAAAIANYLAWEDGEPGAEVYTVSTKRETARICWEEARWQLDFGGRRWAKKLGVEILAHNMHQLASASKLQPLGADINSGDAINPHAYVYDELHAWKDREYRDKLDTALIKRRQPVKWQITTAGTVGSTLWLEEREYATKVLEGVIEDDTYFAWISKVDDEDRWDDEGEWAKAIPSLGVTVQLDTLRQIFRKAREKPSELANAKRLHLGIMAQAQNPWVDLALWDQQSRQRADLEGKDCFLGLDLATKLDVCAAALWFPDGPGGGDVIWRFWVPEDRITERVQRDRVPYDVWVRQGWMEAVPGRVVDEAVVRARILKLGKKYHVRTIGVDPWNATQLSKELEDEGLTVVEIPQGMARLSAATKKTEEMLTSRSFRHGGNPVARWMASNAVARHDGNGNVRLDKNRSLEKIDGMAAVVNAITEWLNERKKTAAIGIWIPD